MPYQNPNTAYQPMNVSGRGTTEKTFLDLRGINLSTPHDVLKDYESPFAQNFRIYAKEEDARQVTVSTRKGPGAYTIPVGEAASDSDTSITGASDETFTETNRKAVQATASRDGRLTKVELNLKKDEGTAGHVRVEIYDDDGGEPGELLSETGILNSDVTASYQYVEARLHNAPLLSNTENYWIVIWAQDNNRGSFYISSNTTGTSLTSNNSGGSWTSQAIGLNFKTYMADDKPVKGVTRYYPSNGQFQTCFIVGGTFYTVDDVTGVITSQKSGLDTSATSYQFIKIDDKLLFNGNTTTDPIQVWDGITVTTLTNAQLPSSSLMTYHYERLFVVDASDPNKVVFSEAPGNEDGAGNFWYEGYKSTSFIYFPSPKVSDPITSIHSFQDTLVVFTKENKFILYGSDPATFNRKQAVGKKGAVSQDATFANENYIYFLADDNFYRFNGSSDEVVGDEVVPEVLSIANPEKANVDGWKGIIRLYYTSEGEPVNDKCLMYHEGLESWMWDTDRYVGRTSYWYNDNNEFIEGSSQYGALFYAEQDLNDLGGPIDFKYWTKHHSFGTPARDKRVRKLFPLVEGQDGDYDLTVKADMDRKGSPKEKQFSLEASGPKWGDQESKWTADGATMRWTWGGSGSFNPRALRFPGNAKTWQFQFERSGINSPVQLLGYALSYKEKRM